MKKILFKSLSCSALLFSSLFLTSCGGGSLPETLSVEVTDNHFAGEFAELFEIVNKNVEIKFEEEENRFKDNSDYNVTFPFTIKVTGENKDLYVDDIYFDLLDENGAVISTLNIGMWNDTFDKIKSDLRSGITGNTYKVEITNLLSYDEAKKLADEVKSVKGGLVDGITEQQEQKASGGLYVEDANFSGPFGDIIKIKNGSYRLKTEYVSVLGKTNIEIKVEIEVLKQSSQKVDKLTINLVNESGSTVYSLYVLNPGTLNEMINKGDVGKTYLMTFFTYEEDEEEVEAVKTAVAVSGGPTRAK